MVGKTKNGKDYIYGTLINQKQTWAFKIWDTTLTAKCKALAEAPEGFKGMVARVTGTVGMYQGALDYTLTSRDGEISYYECEVKNESNVPAYFVNIHRLTGNKS